MNNCMIENLSFGIGFTVDLKIWISQVDLPYACADPEGYGHRSLKFDPSITPIASIPKAHNVVITMSLRNDIMRFSVLGLEAKKG